MQFLAIFEFSKTLIVFLCFPIKFGKVLANLFFNYFCVNMTLKKGGLCFYSDLSVYLSVEVKEINVIIRDFYAVTFEHPN